MLETKAKRYNNLRPVELADKILLILGQFTILREMLNTAPIEELVSYCIALSKGDVLNSVCHYYSMTSALLNANSRRVTGDIWKDFIFSELIEKPNRFSILAAEGRNDPPTLQAMKHDLSLLQKLFLLEDQQLIESINKLSKGSEKKENMISQPIKPTPKEENISRMALSAWAGNDIIPEKKKSAPKIHEIRTEDLSPAKSSDLFSWLYWTYDQPGDAVYYASDEDLVSIYQDLLGEEDWSYLAETLSAFHSKYGYGICIKSQIFSCDDFGLCAQDDLAFPAWDDFTDSSKQKEIIYSNTLRFLRTGEGKNLLIYGDEGIDSRSLLMHIAKELPDLRLLFLPDYDHSSSIEAIKELCRQPFRFIIYIDDISSVEKQHYSRLRSFLMMNSRNALLYAVSPHSIDDSLFAMQIQFRAPDYNAFCQLVRNLIRREGSFISDMTLSDACAQWREDNNSISTQGAHLLAQQLMLDSNS